MADEHEKQDRNACYIIHGRVTKKLVEFETRFSKVESFQLLSDTILPTVSNKDAFLAFKSNNNSGWLLAAIFPQKSLRRKLHKKLGQEGNLVIYQTRRLTIWLQNHFKFESNIANKLTAFLFFTFLSRENFLPDFVYEIINHFSVRRKITFRVNPSWQLIKFHCNQQHKLHRFCC